MKAWHYIGITVAAWFLYYAITKYWEFDVSIWRFFAAGLVLYFAGIINGQRKNYW